MYKPTKIHFAILFKTRKSIERIPIQIYSLPKKSVRKNVRFTIVRFERKVCMLYLEPLKHHGGGDCPCIGQVNFTVWPTSTFSVKLKEDLEKKRRKETWRIIVDDGYLIGFFLHLVAWSIINSTQRSKASHFSVPIDSWRARK